MKNYLIRRLRLIVPIVAALVGGASACAATLTVNSKNDSGGTCPGPTCTLAQAIAVAATGDTINFSVGGSISFPSGGVIITRDVIISGPGANVLNITGADSIFEIDSGNVTMSGLTIGPGDFGFQLIGGTLTLNDCAVSGNDLFGGITTASGTTLVMNRCTISGNQARNDVVDTLGGGGVNSNGTTTLTNCTISGNIAVRDNFSFDGGYGGGLYCAAGTVTLTNCTVTNNGADNAGGGIMAGGGTVTLTSTIVAENGFNSKNQGNVGPDCRGGFSTHGYNLIGIQDGSSGFANNVKHDLVGTAASPRKASLDTLQDNGGPTKTHALLSDSPAIDAGNATGATTDQRGFPRPSDFMNVANAGDGSDTGAFELQDPCGAINHVVKNKNDSGADSLRDVIANVCSGSTITFADDVRGTIDLTTAELVVNKALIIEGPGADLLTLQRSTASGTSGFRVFNVSGSVDVSIAGLTIANGNASSGFGGAILNTATLYMSDDAITGNSAVFGGGGIHNNGGTMSLRNCTVSGNTTNNGGAGILNSGTLSFNRSTLSGNVAQNGNGGGLVNTGTATITRSTIANNSATGAGGGIHGPSGTINMGDTIVALNTAPSGPDFNAILTSQGFNLVGDHDGLLFAKGFASDKIGVTAAQLKLDVLQNNGGPTMTHALLAGSVAIDAGFASGGTTDQRGLLRPVDFPDLPNATGGDGSDIGAFEFQSPMATPTPTPGPTATPTPTPIPPGILGNISTRLQVGTGDNALFAGFIISGNAPKKVLIRSAGPSLGQFGVPGTLGNPTLELHDVNSTIAVNDDWQTTQIGGVISFDQTAEIQNSGAAPTDNAEPAIIATLQPGSYSAIVQGAGGTQGVATVELYDLTPNNGSELANISTRGLVQTGDNVLVGGFIVTTQPTNVLIRATGPSLIPFGISNALANPQLTLHDANGTLAANDDWQTTEMGGVINGNQVGYIQSTGLAPGDPAESAVIALLAPGNYTAIVQGVSGGTGVGLIEVYTIPLD
jgi:hypothetical protein